MRSYLQLVQRLHIECRASGDPPSTVVGQTGQAQDFVNWTADAWFQLQAEHPDWDFLRLTAQFPTIYGQATYSPSQAGLASDALLGMWIKDSFRNWTTSVGQKSEIPMAYRNYEGWRDLYQLGALRTATARPVEMTVTPSKGIGLGPVPLDGYTILGDYYQAAVRLVNDSDTPSLPERHDSMIIVYKAMIDYAFALAAPEVLNRAERKYAQLKNWLENDQLPEVLTGGALA